MNAPAENPLSADFYARFYREAPEVLLDTSGYAVLWKPHNLHSAPLREEDRDNLLFWYLSLPETPAEARRVVGKKPIERGLLHRLDFATAGLVLVAKTQGVFDFLDKAQKAGLFVKSYRAFCNCTAEVCRQPPYAEGSSFCIKSRFRAFGPGGREVRPVFHSRDKRGSPREYATNVAVERIIPDGKFASLLCSLDLGFRHQVRAHLASMGLPVCGDPLYNPLYKPLGTSSSRAGSEAQATFMQLIAVSLSFPAPEGAGQVSFSLPPAGKTSL